MSGDLLDRRALNRAVLHRQQLLRRSTDDLVELTERIGGLNAQQSNDPYLALHSRLEGFAIDDLTRAITDGRLVRSVMMRGTQHLVTAAEFRSLRGVLQPLFTRLQRSTFGRRTAGADLGEVVAEAQALLEGRVMTRPELGRRLAERWPDADRAALAWSVQYLLPVIHPAPSGTWDYRGAVPMALPPEPLDPPDPRRLIRRYLAGYGPAAVADIRAWSGVSGLGEVVAEMRDELRTFHDESGRQLYDLVDAPRPDSATPAPVRLLAGYDNLLLGYADRSRIMTEEVRRRVCVGDLIEQTVLVDGVVAGIWRLDRDAGVVEVHPFTGLSRADAQAVAAEGHRILALAVPEATCHEVRILPP